MRIIVFSLFIGLAIVACSNQPRVTSEEKVSAALEQLKMTPATKTERIRDYQVTGWRYIDAYNLIIQAGLKDQYLVSFQSPCFPLQTAFAIGFTSRTGTLDKFEDIIVRDSVGRPERCAISEIVKLKPIPDGSEEPIPE